MATSCGMAVILTKRATGTAMIAPSTMATRARTRFLPEWRNVGSVKVMATAKDGRRRAEQVALAGVLGRAEEFEGQDEADDGDQVGQVARVGQA